MKYICCAKDVDFNGTVYVSSRAPKLGNVLGVGFEPTRFSPVDLKSTPLDQLGHPSFV